VIRQARFWLQERLSLLDVKVSVSVLSVSHTALQSQRSQPVKQEHCNVVHGRLWPWKMIIASST